LASGWAFRRIAELRSHQQYQAKLLVFLLHNSFYLVLSMLPVKELTRKICMLGDFGVGKTSLVARFVHSAFSEKYVTTVGVKIDTKQLEPQSRRSGDTADDSSDAPRVKLVLWDIAGKNALDSVKLSYLQGTTGVVLVADGTREATLRSALYLLMQARQETNPELPAVLLVNKFDRLDDWEVTAAMLAELRNSLPVFEASALSGEGVEPGFQALTQLMLAGRK
jgi:small GTP-binding protein